MSESTSLKKFQKELKILFRSEDKDFNWGIYRIMNQKNEEITRFIDKEIPNIVEKKITELRKDFGKEIEVELKGLEKSLKDAGVDPKDSPKYQKLLQRKKEGRSLSDFEDAIYNHLIEFFSRYYQDGDFINEFYFKDDQYLIPYDGSETMLHWATKDMYYIKSSDQYKRFSFLTKDEKLSVVFNLSKKLEEKGNKKGSRDKYFVFDDIEFREKELICNIKYVDLNDEIKTLANKVDQRKEILDNEIISKLKEKLGRRVEHLDISKNLKKFKKRYVEDFFIHEDLKGFLEKQMNFYINQEIVHIDFFISDDGDFNDDLKIIAKVFKDICKNIIEKLFLLEEMKKKIWEKKKFILETNYVITLDKIQEYCGNKFLENIVDDIISNIDQKKEWEALFDINIKNSKDLFEKKYDGSIEYKKLPVDTKYFSDEFKWKILSIIYNLDENLDGLLIHSENWQALNLVLEKYREKIKCCYIDPPYNTGSDEFIYKDGFSDSSWISMIKDRLSLSKLLLNDQGVLYSSIDDNEFENEHLLFNELFNKKKTDVFIWKKSGYGRERKMKNVKTFRKDHEYVLTGFKNELMLNKIREKPNFQGDYSNPDNDPRGNWLSGSISRAEYASNKESDNYYSVTSPSGKKITRQFDIPKEDFLKLDKDNRISWGKNGDSVPRIKTFINEKREITPYSVLLTKGSTTGGTTELTNLINNEELAKKLRPKPSFLIQTLSQLGSNDSDIVLDFFAGSGTTAESVIKLNIDEKTKRKFFLIEGGGHFDTVTKNRVKKIIYSLNWKEGKPKDMHSIGGFFKYYKIEQYEDALENIVLKQSTLEMFSENLDILLRYQLEEGIDENKSKNFLGVDIEKEFLDLSIKVLNKDGTTRQQKVDLIETFNYFIGLEINQMKKINENNRDYYIITGKTDGDKTIIIWRNPKDLDKEKDRDFINKQLQNDNYKNIYVNSDCHIQGYKNIYDEMRKRLW